MTISATEAEKQFDEILTQVERGEEVIIEFEKKKFKISLLLQNGKKPAK